MVDSMLYKLNWQDTKKVDCQNLPRQGKAVIQNSLLLKMSVSYAGPVGQK